VKLNLVLLVLGRINVDKLIDMLRTYNEKTNAILREEIIDLDEYDELDLEEEEIELEFLIDSYDNDGAMEEKFTKNSHSSVRVKIYIKLKKRINSNIKGIKDIYNIYKDYIKRFIRLNSIMLGINLIYVFKRRVNMLVILIKDVDKESKGFEFLGLKKRYEVGHKFLYKYVKNRHFFSGMWGLERLDDRLGSLRYYLSYIIQQQEFNAKIRRCNLYRLRSKILRSRVWKEKLLNKESIYRYSRNYKGESHDYVLGKSIDTRNDYFYKYKDLRIYIEEVLSETSEVYTEYYNSEYFEHYYFDIIKDIRVLDKINVKSSLEVLRSDNLYILSVNMRKHERLIYDIKSRKSLVEVYRVDGVIMKLRRILNSIIRSFKR